MNPKLPDDLRKALQQHPGEPLTVEDDKSNANYVVIRLETFQRLQQLVYDDSDVEPQEALPLIAATFEDAEWNMADGKEDDDSPNG